MLRLDMQQREMYEFLHMRVDSGYECLSAWGRLDCKDIMHAACLRVLQSRMNCKSACSRVGNKAAKCCTWWSFNPILSASLRASGVATKQRVTLGLNQTLWQVVRSVTTVAKGMGRCKPPLQLHAQQGFNAVAKPKVQKGSRVCKVGHTEDNVA